MSTKYQMWLTYNAEKEKIQLPVLPLSFHTKNGSSNDSVTIAGLGEIVIMQGRPALQFSFSSFFPASGFSGLQVGRLTKPLSLIKKINSWKEGKSPVHFIATACGVDLYCTIEDFQYSEEGGDPGTYQYSITLKEYREITVRQVKVSVPDAAAVVQKEEPRVDNTVQPRTYTVTSSDNLWKIARNFYGGTGSDWRKIYDANRDIIESTAMRRMGKSSNNGWWIFPGTVLVIP